MLFTKLDIFILSETVFLLDVIIMCPRKKTRSIKINITYLNNTYLLLFKMFMYYMHKTYCFPIIIILTIILFFCFLFFLLYLLFFSFFFQVRHFCWYTIFFQSAHLSWRYIVFTFLCPLHFQTFLFKMNTIYSSYNNIIQYLCINMINNT